METRVFKWKLFCQAHQKMQKTAKLIKIQFQIIRVLLNTCVPPYHQSRGQFCPLLLTILLSQQIIFRN